MALAALIMASDDLGGGDGGLRATLPLLGRTLVEHQLRQAAGAGATHAVVLVERLPAALVAALDRVRRDGIAVEVARSIADAADRFHPDERLLLIADGCVADHALLHALATTAQPVVVTVPDQADTAGYERIDAGARWAGLAVLDGGAVRSTAAMLGDWDAQSTLLRRAVQGGAHRIDAAELGGGRPRIAGDPDDVGALDRSLLQGSRTTAARWPRRWLFAPVEGAAAGWLARSAVDALPVAICSAALAVLGAGAGWSGWPVTGMASALLSGPVAAVAARLARLRLSTIRRGTGIEGARVAGLAAGLMAIAAAQQHAGWMLTGAVTVATMLALLLALHVRQALDEDPGPVWIADPDALAWTLALAAAAGGWRVGLAAALGYAALSFFRIQVDLVRIARHGTSNAV